MRRRAPAFMVTIVKCPTCRRDVPWSEAAAYRPFCSERCRLIDLGAWLTEQRAIADTNDGVDEDTPPPQEPR